jgi:hypothetical protein
VCRNGGKRGVAQACPNKPVRIVVPLPSGGTSDILARLIGNEVSQRIGAGIVAKSPADGYTPLFADVGSLLINQVLSAKPAFDLVRDFSPVTMLTYWSRARSGARACPIPRRWPRPFPVPSPAAGGGGACSRQPGHRQT